MQRQLQCATDVGTRERDAAQRRPYREPAATLPSCNCSVRLDRNMLDHLRAIAAFENTM
jgi:hypothetical protein